MTNNLIIEDPYIYIKVEEFKKTFEDLPLISAKKTIAIKEYTDINLESNQVKQYTVIDSPDQIFYKLKHKLKKILNEPTIKELQETERLINDLPNYYWCQIIKDDIKIPKKKLNIKIRLENLLDEITKKKDLSIDSLKNISKEFQKIIFECNNLSLDDQSISELCKQLSLNITKKQHNLFKENPIDKIKVFGNKLVLDIGNIDNILKYRQKIRQYFPIAQSFNTIELEQTNKNNNKKILIEVIDKYDKSTEWIINHIKDLDDNTLVNVITELELRGVELIKDKHSFIKYLREHLHTISSIKESIIQELLILFLLNNAANSDELLNVLSLLSNQAFNRLNTDNKKIVVKLFFKEHKNKLKHYNSLNEINTDLDPYINRVVNILDKVNNTHLTSKMIPLLKEIPENPKESIIDKKVAKDILLKASINQYRSLKTLLQDIEKAVNGDDLLSNEHLSKLPFILKDKKDNQYKINLNYNQLKSNYKKVYIKVNNNSSATDTITLID